MNETFPLERQGGGHALGENRGHLESEAYQMLGSLRSLKMPSRKAGRLRAFKWPLVRAASLHRATSRSADAPHVAALSSSAVEQIAAIGLQP